MVSLLNVIGKIDLFIELIDEFKELLGIQKFQFYHKINSFLLQIKF